MAKQTFRVYEVLADIDGDGPACDGTAVFRFRNEQTANGFAASSTCYGRPAKVQFDDVPKRIFQRWVREGKI